MIPEPAPARSAPAAVPPSYDDDDDEGAEIQKWLGIMAHAWGVLTVGTIAGGLLGLLAAIRTPPVFEAVSTVILTPPSDPTGVFTAPGLRAIFANPSVASEVVRELGLDRPPHSLTPEAFRTQAFIVEDVPSTYLTRLKVRLSDPQLAARASNRVTERVIELTAQVRRDSIGGQRTQVERQAEAARQELAKAEKEWLSARLKIVEEQVGGRPGYRTRPGSGIGQNGL